MGTLSMNDIYGMQRIPRRRSYAGMPMRRYNNVRMSGMGGMGGFFDNFKYLFRSKHTGGGAPAPAAPNQATINQVKRAQEQAESSLASMRTMIQGAQSSLMQITGMATEDPTVLQYKQQADAAFAEMQSIVRDADMLIGDFESRYSAERSKGGDYASGFVAEAQDMARQFNRALSQVTLGSSAVNMALAQARRRVKEAAEIVRQEEQDRLREERRLADLAAEQQRQIQAEEDARIEEEQRQADLAAAAAEADVEMRRMMLEEQRLAREAQYAREEAERERIRAAEQARIAAEQRRYEMELAAEERKYQIEQERILREEERQLRREEREAEMQRLVMMQELAAKGIPVPSLTTEEEEPTPVPGGIPGLPAGAQPVPGMPGYMMVDDAAYGAYGAAMPAIPGYGMQPTIPAMPAYGAAPMYQPYGMVPQQVPPGYAATMPPAPMAAPAPVAAPMAAQAPMPAYQQGAMPQAPQAMPAYQQTVTAPAPGMQWAAFDPGTEMFGMGGLGALVPSATMQGAMIEEGYQMTPPDQSGTIHLIRPDGSRGPSFTMASAMSKGMITDTYVTPDGKTGERVVFTPPGDGGDGTTEAVAGTIQELIRGVTSVMTERERRKAAKYGPSFLPASISAPAAPRGIPGWAIGVGALGVFGAIVYGITRKKGKKG